MQITTPKFKSADFKRVLGELKEILDAHSLSVLLLDALERRAAEQIYGKVTKGLRNARLQSLEKTELVGQLTAAFFQSDEVAFQVIRELDRSCQKERHIVASIPEAQAPERIGSYRAISLKRERAKLVWALTRDPRPAVRDLANRVITQFFQRSASLETAKEVLAGDEGAESGREEVLAQQIQEQAELLQAASEKVEDLEDRVARAEAERARLLAQIGQRERGLRTETNQRSDLESQLSALRARLQDLESREEEVDKARQSEREAQRAADELQQKVRRLTKLASASSLLTEAQAEIDGLKRERDELVRKLAGAEALRKSVENDAAEREGRLRAELESVRDELKSVRKQLAERDAAPRASPREVSPDAVALLVDQANLAAAAHLRYRKKVDFSGLFPRLVKGRKVVRAVAFVVDNGGHAFQAFCDTLRRAGWDLRIKKPKVFSDGRSKADWDMGIAMEAVDLRDQVETVVLGSGDGDFEPLVRRLRSWGVRVEVASFSDALALDLREAADAVEMLGREALEP